MEFNDGLHSLESEDRWKQAKLRNEYLPDGKYPDMAKAGLRSDCVPESRQSKFVSSVAIVAGVIAVIFGVFAALSQLGII